MSWLSQSPQPVTLRPARSLGGLAFDVTIEELHEDALAITEHPVEQGAAISDHAVRKPATVILRGGISDSGGEAGDAGRSQDLYDALVALQASREPFDIVTGRRIYRNMLIESLATATDAGSEHALIVTAECREVIIVHSRTVTVPPRRRHANPDRTGGISDAGQRQAQPARRSSALRSLFGDGGDRRPGGPE